MNLQQKLSRMWVFEGDSPGVFSVNPTSVWVVPTAAVAVFFRWFFVICSENVHITSRLDPLPKHTVSCWSPCHFRELDSRTWTFCWFLGPKSCHVHLNREVVTYCSIASVVDDRCCLLDIMDTVQRLSCKELCESKTFCRCASPNGAAFDVQLWRNLKNKLLLISINFSLKLPTIAYKDGRLCFAGSFFSTFGWCCFFPAWEYLYVSILYTHEGGVVLLLYTWRDTVSGNPWAMATVSF